MARVYVETWQATYRGILPDAYLDAMTVEETERALTLEMTGQGVIGLLAEWGSEGVVGFVTGGVERRRDCVYGGEIFTLYVRSRFQRRGIGTRLVMDLVERMNRLGVFTVKVQVLRDNPSRRFYERINGTLLNCGRIRFAGTEVPACTYGWIDTDLIRMAA
jgi:ribosomal protein S18 acetylase RimI-like enzyme